jgi:hypothetical protein
MYVIFTLSLCHFLYCHFVVSCCLYLAVGVLTSPQGSHALASSTSSSPSTAPSFSPLPPSTHPEAVDASVDDADVFPMPELNSGGDVGEGCVGAGAACASATMLPVRPLTDAGNTGTAPLPEPSTPVHTAAAASLLQPVGAQPQPTQKQAGMDLDMDVQALMEEMEAGVEEVVVVRSTEPQQYPVSMPAQVSQAPASNQTAMPAEVNTRVSAGSGEAEVAAKAVQQPTAGTSHLSGSPVTAASAVGGHVAMTAALGNSHESFCEGSFPKASVAHTRGVPVPETPTIRRSSPLSSPSQHLQEQPSLPAAALSGPSGTTGSGHQPFYSSEFNSGQAAVVVQAEWSLPSIRSSDSESTTADPSTSAASQHAQAAVPITSLPLSQMPVPASPLHQGPAQAVAQRAAAAHLQPTVQQHSASPTIGVHHDALPDIATESSATQRRSSRSATPSPLRQRLQRLGGVLLQGAALAATGMLGAGITQVSAPPMGGFLQHMAWYVLLRLQLLCSMQGCPGHCCCETRPAKFVNRLPLLQQWLDLAKVLCAAYQQQSVTLHFTAPILSGHSGRVPKYQEPFALARPVQAQQQSST